MAGGLLWDFTLALDPSESLASNSGKQAKEKGLEDVAQHDP